MKDLSFAPGALVDWQLKELVDAGIIEGYDPSHAIQPASMDLTLGSELYQLSGIPPLSATGFDPVSCIKDLTLNTYSLEKPVCITPGNVYLAPLQEHITLPKDIIGYSNPKSSTGRTDITASLIREGETQHNAVTVNGRGKLYVVLQTRSFPVQVSRGVRLIQLRLFSSERQMLQKSDYLRFQRNKALVPNVEPSFSPDGLRLHLDLSGGNLVSLPCQAPVDLNAGNAPLEKYFHSSIPFENSKGKRILFLEADQFLLAVTKERVAIPAQLSATMVPYREEFGPLITHYAGFFDPGFGLQADKRKTGGSSVVCEIRNVSGAPIALEDGQPIGLLAFELNSAKPKALYSGNYKTQQKVTAARYFTPALEK